MLCLNRMRQAKTCKNKKKKELKNLRSIRMLIQNSKVNVIWSFQLTVHELSVWKACDCMCGCILFTVFSKVCSVGSVVWRSQPLQINYCSDRVHGEGSIDSKRCEEDGNRREKRGGLWETGDRKQGRRVREREAERERETEGDRRRKSLRHGWMRLVKMAAWAEKPWNLKQQLRSFFFLRGGGKTLADSTFFLPWYFLKETPAFNIFLLILGIPFSVLCSVACWRHYLQYVCDC